MLTMAVLLLANGGLLGVHMWKRQRPAVSTDVTETFLTYVRQTKEVNHLVLAEHDTVELISQQYSKGVTLPDWEWLRAFAERDRVESTATIEVLCPVHYNYYVDLRAPGWAVEIEDGWAYVEAPAFTAKRPAIDSSGLRLYVDGGYLVFSEHAKAAQLLRELSTRLTVRADELREQVRENCRRSLEDYMARWLTTSGFNHRGVRVRFVDEDARQLTVPHKD